LTIEKFVQGQQRAVYLYGFRKDFDGWAEGHQRPTAARLLAAIDYLADAPLAQLQHQQKLWKYVTATNPKIYELRKDQARLYCCLRGQDIVILVWAVKKQPRADPAVIRLAERRAKEVLESENVNSEVAK
jgi:phage-related protein